MWLGALAHKPKPRVHMSWLGRDQMHHSLTCYNPQFFPPLLRGPGLQLAGPDLRQVLRGHLSQRGGCWWCLREGEARLRAVQHAGGPLGHRLALIGKWEVPEHP